MNQAFLSSYLVRCAGMFQFFSALFQPLFFVPVIATTCVQTNLCDNFEGDLSVFLRDNVSFF